jgi:hypothetical protein
LSSEPRKTAPKGSTYQIRVLLSWSAVGTLEELMTGTRLLVAGLVAAGCAQAQTQAPVPAPQPSGWEATLKAVTEACKSESPQLCPGVSADTALACLQTNIDKLTPGCKEAVVKAARAAVNL